MSGVVKSMVRGSKKILGYEKRYVGLKPKGKMPTPPSEPTVDTAQKDLQEFDRLRRRRGVLANVFGGASGSSPNVGTKTLLGG